MAAEKEFYSVRELAEKLGVVRETIYRLVKKGTLPCQQIGGAMRIRWADVEDYFKRTRKPLSIAELQEILDKLIEARRSMNWYFFELILPVLLRDSWEEEIGLISAAAALELEKRGNED
jgi:excisionase family DNA binding protein